uniref:Guanylate cyclase domain-containing protein n=1 Tax=Zooxanthella nutricula TaxID=1333877 RepID=A0A6U6K5V0_9DINO
MRTEGRLSHDFHYVLRASAEHRNAEPLGYNRYLSAGLRTSFFTDELEAEWFRWHHTHAVCYKMANRIDKHVLALLAISAVDVVRFEYLAHFVEHPFTPHKVYGENTGFGAFGEYGWVRLPVFLMCRGLCYIMLSWWQRRADAGIRRQGRSAKTFLNRDGWLLAKPRQVELLLLCSCCIYGLLFFVSYDAVSNVNKDWLLVKYLNESSSNTQIPTWNRLESFKGEIASVTRATNINSCLFFIVFYIIAALHPFGFWHSVWFFVLGTSLLRLARLEFWYNSVTLAGDRQIWVTSFPLYYTRSSAYNFDIVLLMHAYTAWGLEWDSRARFKALRVLEQTRTRANGFLERLMPKNVVEEIRNLPAQAPPPSHPFRRATIAQSDLVGFTKLSATKKPREVVDMMSDLFGRFDDLTDRRDIWKVETVGDAYIAGQADPQMTQHHSAINVVLFARDMVSAVDAWAHERGFSVRCRVGVHFGRCIGGIVGKSRQRYHLFGHLIRVLEVLEATCFEGRVQVSQACRNEVLRQLRDEKPQEAAEIDDPENWEVREPTAEGELVTSKGEVHYFEEVDGAPCLVTFRPRLDSEI